MVHSQRRRRQEMSALPKEAERRLMARKPGFARKGKVFADHLLSRAVRDGNGCLLFTGATNVQGYGIVGHEGMGTLAHTALWRATRGPIPPGMELDHTCHDPKICQLGPRCPHRRCLDLSHIALVPKGHNNSPERNGGAAKIGIARAAAAKWRKAKTHCPNGHEWTAENTRRSTNSHYNPQRICRACQRIAQLKYLTRKRDASI